MIETIKRSIFKKKCFNYTCLDFNDDKNFTSNTLYLNWLYLDENDNFEKIISIGEK